MAEKKPNHILVIRLSALGDVAMTVPVLRAFTQQYPKVKITVLSKAFLKPLFEELPNVSFYTADVKGKHKGVPGLYRLFKELKQLNIDAVADLHNVLRSKILRSFFRSSGIPLHSIDKGREEKKALTAAKNKVFKQLKTTTERYTDVFRKFGFSIDLSHPTFPPKKELSDKLRDLIQHRSHHKLIGIAPFAQHASKMYPIDLMQKVIEQLSKKDNNTILLFGGGQKEIDILNSIEKKFNNVVNVAGKIRLNEELKLISNLDCMLSMDSGNAHFGAMLGVNTVTLWGVTHPFAGFAPFHQPKENMLLPDLKKYPLIPCSIYGNKVFKGYEDVMRSITPDKVIEKVNTIISKS